MAVGYVYILINASMPGLVKIGYTTNAPETRASELHSTGVPTPFIVAYEESLDFYYAEAERSIHDKLIEIRINKQREFFCMPLKQAISIVAEIASTYREREQKGKIKIAEHDRKKSEYEQKKIAIDQKIKVKQKPHSLKTHKTLHLKRKNLIFFPPHNAPCNALIASHLMS